MTGLPPSNSPSSDSSPNTPGWEFNPRSRAIIDGLKRKSAEADRVVAMYGEALRAIARNDTSESPHVAGYELREFMCAMPLVLAVPVATHEVINAEARVFVDGWKVSGDSNCRAAGEWTGEIDTPLRRAILKAERFSFWFEQSVPTRREEAAQILSRLQPDSRPIPASLMDAKTDQWKDLLQYFNGLTHHDGRSGATSLHARLEELELLLLEHLEPTPFEDQDELDSLMKG